MSWMQAVTSKPGTVISFAALAVSCISVLFGGMSLVFQRRHQRLSVRPIGVISLSDYEDRIGVRIKNAGTGPMIINKIATTNYITGEKRAYPIDWMPTGVTWSDFRKGLEEHAVIQGGEVVLLEYMTSAAALPTLKLREEIRNVLKNLEMAVEYSDIYGKKQKPIYRRFDWFGRH